MQSNAYICIPFFFVCVCSLHTLRARAKALGSYARRVAPSRPPGDYSRCHSTEIAKRAPVWLGGGPAISVMDRWAAAQRIA